MRRNREGWNDPRRHLLLYLLILPAMVWAAVTAAVTQTRGEQSLAGWRVEAADHNDNKPFYSANTWNTKAECDAFLAGPDGQAAWQRLQAMILLRAGPSYLAKVDPPTCVEVGDPA